MTALTEDSRASDGLVIEAHDLKKYFPVRTGFLRRVTGYVKAVDGVSITVRRGECVGLVGESGCGKSTTGRLLLKLLPLDGGRIVFKGTDISSLSQTEFRPLRRYMQIIFQDPFSSLNPRFTIGKTISEGLEIFEPQVSRAQRRERVNELLRLVGLSEDAYERYPHEFSGGQRQRICIARAISLNPDFVVCDEPVSSLDVSIQAQIINLLEDLQRQLGLSYLFISHDLAVVRHISNRVMVMYLGKIVESGTVAHIFERRRHPYTAALLSAVPVPDPLQKRKRIILGGDVPSPANPPAGCTFHPRCPIATERCSQSFPPLVENEPGHLVACYRSSEGLV